MSRSHQEELPEAERRLQCALSSFCTQARTHDAGLAHLEAVGGDHDGTLPDTPCHAAGRPARGLLCGATPRAAAVLRENLRIGMQFSALHACGHACLQVACTVALMVTAAVPACRAWIDGAHPVGASIQ